VIMMNRDYKNNLLQISKTKIIMMKMIMMKMLNWMRKKKN